MKIPSLACYSPPAVRPIPNRPQTCTGPWPGGWGSRIEPDFFTTYPQTTVSRCLPLYHPRLFLFAHELIQNNARTLLKYSDLSISGSIPFLLLHLYWSRLQLYLFLCCCLILYVCFLGTTSNCGLILN